MESELRSLLLYVQWALSIAISWAGIIVLINITFKSNVSKRSFQIDFLLCRLSTF